MRSARDRAKREAILKVVPLGFNQLLIRELMKAAGGKENFLPDKCHELLRCFGTVSISEDEVCKA